VDLFGIHLLGFDRHTAVKLLLTVALIVVYALLRRALSGARGPRTAEPTTIARTAFWLRQFTSVALLVLLVLALVSVWFDQPGRLATAAGLFTAGVAFALQRVITSVAAYIVILRGSTFSVGDRIVMGGVRGDVIALDPFQTTIMEMGQSPGEQGDAPSIWISGRQFTGRIVTVNNGVIFDQPVYNYTRDFPYIWEELSIPIPYDGNDARAEAILLAAAAKHAVDPKTIGDAAALRLQRVYGIAPPDVAPHAYYKLTDNWIEITVRCLVPDHGARVAKDAMSREILAAFRAEGIQVASGTYQIVGVPAIRVITEPASPGSSLT
jgi:small-conductance mechanosensitive channel